MRAGKNSIQKSTSNIIRPIADFTSDLEKFSNYLYNQLSHGNPKKNIIFSPFSIQLCAAMLLVGADRDSETFRELKDGLQFTTSNIYEIANGFDTVLTAYHQYNILKMANKLYIKEGLQIHEKYSQFLTKKFHSKPQTIHFDNNVESAKQINGWVSSRTNKLINEIIKPEALSSETRLVLVNAIHFKGEWEIRFDENDTKEDDFFVSDNQKIRVSMMHVENDFLFADLRELDSTALQMDYKDSDLSMLLILPNTKTGLRELEHKLQSTTLKKITDLLTRSAVDVKIPKFKAEFDQEFSSIFKALGLKRVFANDAQLSKMLKSNDPLKVSQIFHRAFIEVNELGTEAAAATAMVVMIRSMPATPPKRKQFYANKPFYYTIFHRSYGSLFIGNVINNIAAVGSMVKSSIMSASHIRVAFQANRPFFYAIINSDGIRFLEGIVKGNIECIQDKQLKKKYKKY